MSDYDKIMEMNVKNRNIDTANTMSKMRLIKKQRERIKDYFTKNNLTTKGVINKYMDIVEDNPNIDILEILENDFNKSKPSKSDDKLKEKVADLKDENKDLKKYIKQLEKHIHKLEK